MPSRKFKKRSFRRRGGKRKGSSFGKKLLRDAKKRGINSAAEAAVAIIAKKQAQKLLPPNLMFRRYLFADYDSLTQVFSHESPVDLSGLIVHIAQVPRWDAQTMPAVAPTSDVDLRPTVPVYPRGANVVAPTVNKDGYRWSNKITIKNINIGLRFTLPPVVGVGVEKMSHTIFYGIGYWGGDDIFAMQAAPQPSAVMSDPKSFGFSNRLDNLQPELEKFRFLKRGVCRIKYTENQSQPKTVSKSMFWSGSLPYEYNSLNMNGQLIAGNKKLFLVLRCDTALAATQKPTVAAFVKLGYRDNV